MSMYKRIYKSRQHMESCFFLDWPFPLINNHKEVKNAIHDPVCYSTTRNVWIEGRTARLQTGLFL